MIVETTLDVWGGGGGAFVDDSVGGCCPGVDGLCTGGFFVSEGAWGVVDVVETTGGGVDDGFAEGVGGVELGSLVGGVELGAAEVVGASDLESVAAAVGLSSTSVPCRCSIAFTSRTSTLRLLKVASATESAESPITNRSRSRLECIVARFGLGD